MVRVLVVDDQPILRESLKFIIEQDPEIEVVGCAGNGNEAFEFCKTTVPDVVLMDLVMPICDGVMGTELIKSNYPDVRVLILTVYGDNENVVNALKKGAEGYILKDIDPHGLRQAIKSIAGGIPVVHQAALSGVIHRVNEMERTLLEHKRFIVEFSRKELEIIRLIVAGKNNKEIAACIHFSEGNVKNTISRILDKLNLQDRTQLAVYAVKNNLV